MATSRDLIVRILADTTSLDKGVNTTNEKLGGLARGAKVVAGAFAAYQGAQVAVDFLSDSADAAEQDKKSQALLAQQLKTSTGATKEQVAAAEKYITKLELQTGVMDDDLRPAYSALARASGSTEEAQTELGLAMDISAARGIDLTTVTTALEKAHNGNIGALSRLGIATKDAAGNTLTLEQAMAQAQQTYQGAAEAAVTPGQRMSAAWHELQEQIGTALLPVLENLSTFMADTLLPAFENAITWIQQNWPQIEADIKSTFDKIKPWLDEFVHSIQLAFDTVKGIFEVVSDLLHGHWSQAWQDFKSMIGNVFGDIVKLVGDKVDQVKTLFGGLVSWIADLPGKIASAAVGLFDGVVNAGKSAFNKVIDFFNELLSHIGLHIHIDPPGPGSVNFDWDAPQVPHLDTGGTILGTGLAVVHKGETVVPAGGFGGGGGNTYNLAFTILNPRDVLQIIQQIDRTYGGVPINVRTPA